VPHGYFFGAILNIFLPQQLAPSVAPHGLIT
jgi:hypothetical protein